MQRAFITGASGFAGMYLMDHIQSMGWDVMGYGARIPADNRFLIHEGDVRDGARLRHILGDFQPDVIYHLAGVLKSKEPWEFFDVNVMGTLSLFDAVMKSGLRPHVVVASSSAVYGSRASTQPVQETSQPRPVTYYAVSKFAQEMVACHYFDSAGLPVTRVRTFNLLGPGLSTEMAPSAFAKQVAQAEKNGKPAKIFTGNLSAQRDYVDVRDAVRAYFLIARHGTPGQVYNVCSGRAVAMTTILQILLDQARVPIEAAFDPKRFQKNDVSVQIGDVTKVQSATGWEATIPIQKSLEDLLDHFRTVVRLEKA